VTPNLPPGALLTRPQLDNAREILRIQEQIYMLKNPEEGAAADAALRRMQDALGRATTARALAALIEALGLVPRTSYGRIADKLEGK
jgi:hypothetical protein